MGRRLDAARARWPRQMRQAAGHELVARPVLPMFGGRPEGWTVLIDGEARASGFATAGEALAFGALVVEGIGLNSLTT